MGISYSAVKLNTPEAWELGKDYYHLVDLFPATKFNANESGGLFSDLLPPDMPPRWVPGKADPFVITELYPTVEDFIAKLEELKGDKVNEFELPHLRSFYHWAGNDPIAVIGEIGGWAYDDDPDPTDGQWCGPLKDYRHMDSWNGEPGRKISDLYEEEENA